MKSGLMFLAVLVTVLTVLLGTSALVVLWPLAAVSGAVLYCLDKPARRRAWPIVVVALVAVGVVFRVGGWHPSLAATGRLVLLAVPLVVGVGIVFACGGPTRIRARHELAAERRRILRAARVAQRRQDRKDSVKRRTGLDVDVVGGVTRDYAGRVTRAVGGRLNRRLERRRPATEERPADLLDLDADVSADLSRQQRAEILDLAEKLERPRPSPNGRR